MGHETTIISYIKKKNHESQISIKKIISKDETEKKNHLKKRQKKSRVSMG